MSRAPIVEPPIALPDLAKQWNWPQDKLYRLVADGKIPHLRLNGRIFFEASRLEAWKASLRKNDAREQARLHPPARTREQELRDLGIDPNVLYPWD